MRAATAGVNFQLSIMASLGAIAERVGLDAWPHDFKVLQGGLLTLLDAAGNPARIAEFSQRNAEFEAKGRRPPSGVSALVPAPHPGEELKQAARRLRLRHNAMVGAYLGRAGLDDLVMLGRDHRCSIDILVDGEKLRLVAGGEVDDAVLGLARLAERSGKASPTAEVPAELPAVEAATTVSGTVVDPATPEVKPSGRPVGFG